MASSFLHVLLFTAKIGTAFQFSRNYLKRLALDFSEKMFSTGTFNIVKIPPSPQNEYVKTTLKIWSRR
jgi:hypothetical protein